jgi:propanol-preferring alcohol dehydrogenase
MLAMVLERPRGPLVATHRALPVPGPGDIRVRVTACAVCRTDLHVIDDDLPGIRHPLVPGHEVVGRVDATGPGTDIAIGTRVGIPWLAHTCGVCEFCLRGEENLCDRARFTGLDRDGGFAEYIVAEAAYCLRLPDTLDDLHAAPLLCAGLIGYRALRMTGDARRLGLYGFGAAAHIVAQVARFEARECHAFVRPGDAAAARFALELGCAWAGDSDSQAPVPLDAAIVFAPVGTLVPRALAAVRKGGTVVCGGIHMSDIPAMPYAALWGERVLRSVANLTRRDGEEFLELAPRIPVRTHVTTYALTAANDAIAALRGGELVGAAVLRPERPSS